MRWWTMTLLHLKESLAKFDPDMDSSEIFLITTKADDEREYSLLAATGYIAVEGTAYLALISESEAKKELAK